MTPTLLRFLDYYLVPKWFHRSRRNHIMSSITSEQLAALQKRVDYCCKLTKPTPIHDATSVSSYIFPIFQRRRHSAYFLDLYQTLRYFPGDASFRYIFGDVTHVPDEPAFVKSRPVAGDNENSVLLSLDRRRHFRFVADKLPFRQKKDMLVSRTNWACASAQRTLLNRMFLNHPMCDVGKVELERDEDFPESVKGFLTIPQQLEYKFIACIEGVDVATNLKWVMSSNSIAVMPRPCYETWFMEGMLRPDYHYIEVKPDFSDLIEKLRHYMAHPDEAEVIIEHAHAYVAQFRDETVEQAAQLLVAQKYFDLCNCAR